MAAALLLIPVVGYLTQSNFISPMIDHTVRTYYNIPAILQYTDEKNPMLDGNIGNPMERNPKTYFGTPTQLHPARIEGNVVYDDQFYDAPLPGIEMVDRMKRINEYYNTSTIGVRNNWRPNYSDNRYKRISFMPNEALQKYTIKRNMSKGKYHKNFPIRSVSISPSE